MKELLYFVLGAFCIELLLPVLDSLCGLIMTWIEVSKAKAAVKMAKYAEQTKTKDTTYAIGFDWVNNEDYEEEEEE